MNNKKYIVGNWKMNQNKNETINFLKDFEIFKKNYQIKNNYIYGIAPNFTNLCLFEEQDMLLCAQNVNENNKGAFTGETNIEMLKSWGVKAVILGHSERRMFFNETNEIINKKLHLVLENQMMPIVCVGENEEQYNSGQTKNVIREQISKSFKNIKDFSKIIIAYEPIWAIGTGKVATAQIAQDICKFIRSLTSPDVIIQYGGSVNPKNIGEILARDDINGALVGGASLDAKSFIDLLI